MFPFSPKMAHNIILTLLTNWVFHIQYYAIIFTNQVLRRFLREEITKKFNGHFNLRDN